MITTVAFLISVAAAVTALSMMVLREHRSALKLRSGLLDTAAGHLVDPSITLAGDHFPVLSGRLADGRQVRMELIADTLVFRRLPQLWLKMTLRESATCDRPSIGVLARPTGAEFYSIVHGFQEWMAPPQTESALLMRGDADASPRDIERAGALFQSLFSDPTVKEAAITPGGARLIRQVGQGDRGAHLLLRQVRFPNQIISFDLVRTAIAELEALSEVLSEDSVVPERLSA
jgi:hypothetical protein